MDLALAFRKVRFEKNWQQGVVAKKARISQTYLSQIESGDKVPSQTVINKLLKVYNVPMIVIAWLGMEEKDIQPKKKEEFTIVKPAMDGLISEMIKN